MDIGGEAASPLDALRLPSRQTSTLLRFLSLGGAQRAALSAREWDDVLTALQAAVEGLAEQLQRGAVSERTRSTVPAATIVAVDDMLQSALEPLSRDPHGELARHRLDWFSARDLRPYILLGVYANMTRSAGLLLGRLGDRVPTDVYAGSIVQYILALQDRLAESLEVLQTGKIAEGTLTDALVSVASLLRAEYMRLAYVNPQRFSDAHDAVVAAPLHSRDRASKRRDVHEMDGLTVLSAHLDALPTLSVQITYQIILCLWMLSFSVSTLTATPFERAQVPARLVRTLSGVKAEKLVRISVATLANLAAADVTLCREMVGAGLVAALAANESTLRRFPDEELRHDLQRLQERLSVQLRTMSTYEVYVEEVMSSALSWTPPHQDVLFWKQHAAQMEANDALVLRRLADIVRKPSDATVLGIALHDLSQFMRAHPRGKVIVERLHIKPRLLELIAHPEADVKKRALHCLQILLTSQWSALRT
ncbi:hypothetical protein CDCA_CDCA05G1525 [Cyanidium caldarium]|uniref:ATPase V1 complex subunit H C-terminal domain-containing protein n=1 Tax=Cyanidium caldarium TaxID=2771 RepID=A0AAV9ITR3_CYACA|nr:hypothetical protein CDCA_CDCA05G1525 [Cyanidium caldarium]